MNLCQFLNDAFFIKYKYFLELAKVKVGNIYIGIIRTFCLQKFLLEAYVFL